VIAVFTQSNGSTGNWRLDGLSLPAEALAKAGGGWMYERRTLILLQNKHCFWKKKAPHEIETDFSTFPLLSGMVLFTIFKPNFH
jgi:hypothetical protein